MFLCLALQAKARRTIRSVQLVPPLIWPARPDDDLTRRTVTSAVRAWQKGDAATSEKAPAAGTATVRAMAAKTTAPTPAGGPAPPFDPLSTCRAS
jgi:hypothetical protein